MISAPAASLDTLNQVLIDMVKEVFGDMASWRHTKEENERLTRENLALLDKPDTYERELDYLLEGTAMSGCQTHLTKT